MKILHYAPTMQRGGATQLAADLSYALQAFDHMQSVLVAPAGAMAAAPASSQLRHVPYRSGLIPGKWGRIFKLRSLITERKPDIVQAYGYEAIHQAVKACRLIPAEHRPKLVGAITGYPPQMEQLHAPELAACDSITVISKHLRQRLKKENPSLIKSWVIPYGVNETLCYPGYKSSAEWQASWLSKRPECSERFVVCVPGPISALHGTADIIPIAITLLRQDIPVQMLLTGDPQKADPTYLSGLRRKLRLAGLDSYVSWEPRSASLRDIMCSCHAVINLATAPEAYNRPALEALALGRPLVGYDQGAVGEYLEAFQPVGIVPVGDCDAIADVLSQWHTYPPDPVEQIPYPYRLTDTAKSYSDLYNTIL